MAATFCPSGEWVGYYTYDGKPTKCPVHQTLEFGDGHVRGAGIDNPGQFLIEGSYEDASGRVRWAKQYIGKHGVHYEGTAKDDEIAGSWFLKQNKQGREVVLRGEFRIWPLPDGIYGDDEPLQSVLEREIRRKAYV
ncbi:MAG TPA: hypothetical protein VKE94_01030 [Gemmataceae bacterium]|nr:hypothetical protein [Gemmataceae bacterium]